MRYILSILSIVLIALFTFELSTASAVANQTVSGEARITIIKKQPTLSPRAQLLVLKRSLAVVKAKITSLKIKIANLKKVIAARIKRNLATTLQEKQLKTLMKQLNQAEQTASEIQKKIEDTGSGAINKI